MPIGSTHSVTLDQLESSACGYNEKCLLSNSRKTLTVSFKFGADPGMLIMLHEYIFWITQPVILRILYKLIIFEPLSESFGMLLLNLFVGRLHWHYWSLLSCCTLSFWVPCIQGIVTGRWCMYSKLMILVDIFDTEKSPSQVNKGIKKCICIIKEILKDTICQCPGLKASFFPERPNFSSCQAKKILA